MRALFACWPFEGHVFPQMGIARALRDRGNEVAFYTGDRARAVIESEGFAVYPFQRLGGGQWPPAQLQAEDFSGRAHSVRAKHLAFSAWLVESIPDQLADLESIIESWQPDMLVSDPTMWASPLILWEAVPIPVALSSPFMGPLIPGPDAPWGLGLPPARSGMQRLLALLLRLATDAVASGLRRRVNEFRAAHGLTRIAGSVTAFCGRLPLYLVGNISELDYNRRDLPPTVHYVGLCTWHPQPDSETAGWLDALPADRPWIYCSEGTVHVQDPFLLRAAAQGLGGQDLEVVLTTGWQRDARQLDLGPLASNIHVRRWLSHEELLPRCAVVVTTGGAGTVLGALEAGVPLVVVPNNWDKPDNARRVLEVGAGIVLSPRRCTPAGLRMAVERVLREPTYRANALRIAERLAQAPGPMRAAELLEELAARAGRPTTPSHKVGGP